VTRNPPSIWWSAFGYFACYAPYAALTKALSSGLISGRPAVDGLALLPSSVCASFVGMALFLWVTGWWRHAAALDRWTFLSGLCTSAILLTTTLSYAIPGASIVFMMLLMRGGVLLIAPLVDLLSGRAVSGPSKVALGLSLGALVLAWAEKRAFGLSALGALDVGIYLAAYFLRLRLMSWGAKSNDPDATLRWFAAEQVVAAPSALVLLALLGMFNLGEASASVRDGWALVGDPLPLVVGFLSQGTGIFGGLILLDKRENTFCVPVNRASSIVAGLVGSLALWLLFGEAPPSSWQVAGAGLVGAALVILSLPRR
jgi:hypothetical protein